MYSTCTVTVHAHAREGVRENVHLNFLHSIMFSSICMYRNPSHAQRPSFTFLMRELKRNPDNLLRVEPGHAHLLGAPLEVAKDLYLDLQQMYTV